MNKQNVVIDHPQAHYLLSYHGIVFRNFQGNALMQKMPPLEKLTYLYSNLGAIVMRYNLTFSQRASAIQQLVEYNYSENPVEKIVSGDDDRFVFDFPIPFSVHKVTQANYYLEAIAHQSIGRSRVSNERMQRLVKHNKKLTHGEQKIWDIIHCPVWTVGIDFHTELDKQGFIYIACPVNASQQSRLEIDQALRKQEFKYIEDQSKKVIQLYNGTRLDIFSVDKINLILDDKKQYTQEHNQFAIKVDNHGSIAALGWIMFENIQSILPQWCCEDIAKLSILKKLGVNTLNQEQKKLLFSGSLSDGPLISWKENRAFNCIYNILLVLEQYGFDPYVLLSADKISALHMRLNEAFKKEPDLIDDLLTGALQLEMIQLLIKTRHNSLREAAPNRFTDSFAVSSNTIRALAYAFDIRDSKGRSVLRNAQVELSNKVLDEDIHVHGQLSSPSLNTGTHVSVLLSTAILVAEQILLEQVVSQAYVDCKTEPSIARVHPFRIFLCQVSSDPDRLWTKCFNLAEISPKASESGVPILGLRYEYCQNFIEELRVQTGFDQLIMICEKFALPEVHTDEVIENLNPNELNHLRVGLKHLYLIGEYLQNNWPTSVGDIGASGINAGLVYLIARLSPYLHEELNLQITFDDFATVPPRDKEQAKVRYTQHIIKQCPFNLENIQ